jgi:dipeptidyl aminopeptidase/acylaminoacyl peptidase
MELRTFGDNPVCIIPWIVASILQAGQADDALLESPYQRLRRPDAAAGVYKTRIAPHWLADTNHFWYRNDLRASKEFVLVDADRGSRQPAFDHRKLAAGLSKAAGSDYSAEKLPFDEIAFSDGGKTVVFKVGDAAWKCDLTSYECSKAEHWPGAPSSATGDRPLRRALDWPSYRSPDGKWMAFFRQQNLFVRGSDGKDVQLSQDGKEGLAYGLAFWSPDSRVLAAYRIEPGDRKEVYLIESSPPGGGRAKLRTRPYALPGDKFAAYELNLFTVPDGKQQKPNVERVDYDSPQVHWKKDGRHFIYEKVDRGHQHFRVIEVDAQTGAARNLIDEKSETFIWTAHAENLRLKTVNYLDDSDELIYVSERDGWRHLYLIDSKEGVVKNQITRGEYVVRGIDRIDEKNRQVWFHAGGKNPDQDPYFVHYYRVNFDGTGLTALTEGDGTHTVQYSPDRRFLIDTYSRVDMAPVHDLRRTADGKQVCLLERADDSELRAKGWRPPEVFVAKGRDDKTDIWGVIWRPGQFDSAKKYPVIEYIYAGPQGSFVPKAFSSFARFSLTNLGFIVVQIDGMGTANRSKAFHDVCWKNLKDAGFPDRILWHQAVARKYPYYDITRVGIFGGSAGGQNSTAGVLFHPEFYKVAVSGCGCHDNRMDKASWNEQWMGYPVGPQYAASSNIDNAYRLKGKLLLILGEMDNNVPPESTLRLADALIKAGKDFDLVFVPGADHGMGGNYGNRRLEDFFVRHLLGAEPPNRNGASTAVSSTSAAKKTSPAMPPVTPPPESFFQKIREKNRPAALEFYKKYIDVNGLPVAAAAEVADEALQRTFSIVTHLLAGRPDVLRTMADNGTRLIVIGKDQVYTDMPEYRASPNPQYMNERVRGTGGFDVTSFGEENLLNLPIDRYDDESIGVHEFCHTIDAALGRIDSTWRRRLRETYRQAVDSGLWKNAYAGSNPAEYWAEICQSYFDCNRVNNWNHAAIGTREQLKLYDPQGYELVKKTFNLSPEQDWRYQPLRKQPSVIPPPARFKIDPYYTKFSYAREFPVLGSKQVRDEALLKANDTIRKMFAYRHDILKAMIAAGARLVVLGREERLSDLPEFRNGQNREELDSVRCLDYTPELKLMVVPEENVLGEANDPFAGASLVVSVFAKGLYHATASRPVIPDFSRRRELQQYELRVKRLDVEFDNRLQKLYEEAKAKNLWKGTPAARNRVEYWATGVLSYFNAAGTGLAAGSANRPVTTREALKAYDADLFALVEETMAYNGHVDWCYHRPALLAP